MITCQITVAWECPHCQKEFTDDVEQIFVKKVTDTPHHYHHEPYIILRCRLCDAEFEGRLP